jgi:hypothetical protein
MHSILWASVGVSAGVAIITTVLIDFLFKPGLEARKDRILEKRRDKRAAMVNLRRATRLVNNLKLFASGALMQFAGQIENPALVRERMDNLMAELSECIVKVHTTIDIPNEVFEQWATLGTMTQLVTEVFHLRPMNDEALVDLLDYLFRLLQFFNRYLAAPKWNLRRRQHLRDEISSLMLPKRNYDCGSASRGGPPVTSSLEGRFTQRLSLLLPRTEPVCSSSGYSSMSPVSASFWHAADVGRAA